MIVKLCWIYFIYSLIHCGAGENIAQLVPQTIQIKEYQNTTFSCYSLNSSVNAIRYQWIVNNISFLILINSINCTHIHLNQSYLLNNSYHGMCGNQTHSSLLLTNISRTVKNIRCSITTNTEQFFSEKSYIHVLYPPIVKPMTNISVIVDSRVSIKCNATVGNPSNTTFIWTKNVDTSTASGEKLVLGNVSRRDAALYTCTVNNTMTPTYGESSDGRDSGSFYLDVLYPPTIQDMMDMIVIENRTLVVKCLVSNSNPPTSSVKWLYDGEVVSENVSLRITHASRNKKGIYICEANYTMKPTSGDVVLGETAGNFTLNVAYPPSVNIMEHISVIFESKFERACEFTAGFPSETTIKWTRDIDDFVYVGKTLFFENVSTRASSKYKCTANNTMIPTYGSAVYGSDSGAFFMDVLFSPEFTHPLRNSSVPEGDNFTVTCEASVGNPQETFYNWTRNGLLLSNTSVLEIPKVNRGDESVYACTIFNIMTPTDGGTVVMPKTSDFHLDVLFKAKVTKLLANDKTGELIISNGNSLLIECSVEGNPVAESLLYRTIQTDSDIVILTSLYHNVMNASYIDAGIYVCTGRNNYTIGDAPRREITVIVKGPPRPYPDISNTTKVYTALHGTTNLYFKAHPYLDVIGATRFIWYNGTSHLHADDVRVKITTNYIQSVVIITDIVEPDFGKYWVEVINSVGTYSHFFELLERESDITHVQESTSGGLVIGIALAGVVFGAGLIASLWFFHRRYHKRKANTNSGIKYYTNVETVVSEIGEHGEGGVTFYDRVMPIEDRGTVEKHELTYETLNTTEAPGSETNPVYTNLNL